MSYFFKSIYLRERKSKICSLNVKHTGIRCRLEGRKRISGGFLEPLSHGLHCLALYYKRGGLTVIE